MDEALLGEVVREMPPLERLTYVLHWTSRPDLGAAQAALSRRERSVAARNAFALLKQELLRTLERSGPVWIQDMPGTADALVSATSEVWQGIARLLEGRTDVRLEANRIVATTSAHGLETEAGTRPCESRRSRRT